MRASIFNLLLVLISFLLFLYFLPSLLLFFTVSFGFGKLNFLPSSCFLKANSYVGAFIILVFSSIFVSCNFDGTNIILSWFSMNSILNLSIINLITLLEYFFIFFLISSVMVFKIIFPVITLFIANFINLFIFGLLAVTIFYFYQLWSVGVLSLSLFYYLFLTNIEYFLFILSLLEIFSTLFQSITLSNRLTINVFSGTLLLGLITSFINTLLSGFFISLVLINIIQIFIYSSCLILIFLLFSGFYFFEILVLLIQLLIFLVLYQIYSNYDNFTFLLIIAALWDIFWRYYTREPNVDVDAVDDPSDFSDTTSTVVVTEYSVEATASISPIDQLINFLSSEIDINFWFFTLHTSFSSLIVSIFLLLIIILVLRIITSIVILVRLIKSNDYFFLFFIKLHVLYLLYDFHKLNYSSCFLNNFTILYYNIIGFLLCLSFTFKNTFKFHFNFYRTINITIFFLFKLDLNLIYCLILFICFFGFGYKLLLLFFILFLKDTNPSSRQDWSNLTRNGRIPGCVFYQLRLRAFGFDYHRSIYLDFEMFVADIMFWISWGFSYADSGNAVENGVPYYYVALALPLWIYPATAIALAIIFGGPLLPDKIHDNRKKSECSDESNDEPEFLDYY